MDDVSVCAERRNNDEQYRVVISSKIEISENQIILFIKHLASNGSGVFYIVLSKQDASKQEW